MRDREGKMTINTFKEDDRWRRRREGLLTTSATDAAEKRLVGDLPWERGTL